MGQLVHPLIFLFLKKPSAECSFSYKKVFQPARLPIGSLQKTIKAASIALNRSQKKITLFLFLERAPQTNTAGTNLKAPANFVLGKFLRTPFLLQIPINRIDHHNTYCYTQRYIGQPMCSAP